MTGKEAPQRLCYTSVPALLTALVLSVVLLGFAMVGWYAIGPDLRAQITWPQAATLLFFIVTMIAVMLSVGYSRLWAADGELVVRNGPVVRRYSVREIVGLRLRPGDPWASVLLKADDGELVRKPVLAIQFLEGEKGKRKVRELRRWLVANGAASRASAAEDNRDGENEAGQ